MKNLKLLSKRSLALFLALVMCLGMMQIAAFADDTGIEPDDTIQNEEITGNSLADPVEEEEEKEETPPAPAPDPAEEEEEDEEEETPSAPAPDPAEEEESTTQVTPAPAPDAEQTSSRPMSKAPAAAPAAVTYYQVIFDANGGEGTPPVPLEVPDWTVGLNSIGLELPDQGNLTKDGYKFVGWAQSADGKVPTTPNDVWVFGADVTLYAIWEEDGQESFTVSLDYELNGLAATIPGHPAERVNAGESFSWTVKECSVTPPAGKKFAGWNTKADGTGETYQAGATLSVTPTEDTDIILYAQWKAIVNTLTVKFDANGGSGTMEDLVVEANANNMAIYNLPDCGFTPPVGKKFDCWASAYAENYTYQVGSQQFAFLSNGSTFTAYNAKWVDDPDFVCTCTEKCGATGNPNCAVCKGHKELCKGMPFRPVDIYVHFVPVDRTVSDTPAPELKDVKTNYALTYSYTVGGKETTETLTYESAERIPDYSQTHGLNEWLYHNDPALKWSIKVPVPNGYKWTQVSITQANYDIDGFIFKSKYLDSFKITSDEAEHPDSATEWHAYNRYEERTVTVRWVNDDDAELLKQENVKLSEIPEAGKYNELSGKNNPTKEADKDFTYEFEQWVKSADTEGNVTYKAQYKATTRQPDMVTVTWLDGHSGAQVGEIKQVVKGTTEVGQDLYPVNPTRTNYTFTVWGEPVIDEETGNITITAQWSEDQFTVTWLTGYGNNDTIQSRTYGKATQATNYQGEYPVGLTRPGSYRFDGWGAPVDDGNGNLTITAQWTYTGSESGGGGGGGSDPTPPRPTNPDPENPPVNIPDEQPPLTEEPTVDIPDEEPPLTEEPTVDIPDEQPPLAEEPEVEIPEEEVPLAGVPQTGEASTVLWLAAALMAGAGLVYFNTGKRKEENQ